MTTDRVVRPFEWGLDWAEEWPVRLPEVLRPDEPSDYLLGLSDKIVQQSDHFFSYDTPTDFDLQGDRLTFTSACRTPYPSNDHVKAKWLPSVSKSGEPSSKACIVLPHWNSQEHSYMGLCRMIQRLGISALRLSLPYHDRRMPAELHRADYAVSSNIGRTIGATRQAIVDIRSCVDWLEKQGHRKIGILGTSLGSCYAFLASAHDHRLTVNAYNHCSAYVADVVWTGLATRHIRQGLETKISLERLRDIWMCISPEPYIQKYGESAKRSLFIYAEYDTSFLPEFSRQIVGQIEKHCRDYQVATLPCGHYTTGEFPYKFIDGFYLARFLMSAFKS